MPKEFLNPDRSAHAVLTHVTNADPDYSQGLGAGVRMKARILLFAVVAIAVMAMQVAVAGPLIGARVTRIINDVKLVATDKAPRPAALNEPVDPGSAVRTGIDSRTELLFSDQTITRLGPNSHFAVNNGTREISLAKGSILLQVPKDSGGAKIQTNAVTAAITGTTILLEVVNGITKLTVLEGTCVLVLKNDLLNHRTTVTAGQQVRFSNNATEIPQPRRISLQAFFKNSLLLSGTWGVKLDPTYLNKALAAQEGIDFGGVGVLKVNGVVLINKKPANDGDTVRSGDIIETAEGQTAIIIVTDGGKITIDNRSRVRIGGGENEPVTATALFGKVTTFGLGDVSNESGFLVTESSGYMFALGLGNFSSSGGGSGGSSGNGGVITVVLPGGLILIFDSLGRFIRVQ